MKCREMTVRFLNPQFNSQSITPRDGAVALFVDVDRAARILFCHYVEKDGHYSKTISWPLANVQEWCCMGRIMETVAL